MSIYSKDRIINAGEKFTGNAVLYITGLTTAVISDGSGNVVATLEAGVSYTDTWPAGVFTVTSGSIKLWG